MNWAEFKGSLCYLCLPGALVSSWTLTQEIASSNSMFCKKYVSNCTDSTDSIQCHLGKTLIDLFFLERTTGKVNVFFVLQII